jgi:hypothetical protein
VTLEPLVLLDQPALKAPLVKLVRLGRRDQRVTPVKLAQSDQ